MKVPTLTDAWDRHWQSSADEAAYCSEGVSDAATRGFWNEVFNSVVDLAPGLAIADFCSGNGAVLRAAAEVLGPKPACFCCIDRSAAAISAIQRRFPGVRGIVSDARSTPLADGEFILVTSQFGIEYAGLDAVSEMLRVLGRGGALALLLHHAGSPVSAQCRTNVEALARLDQLQYLPVTRRTFEAAFAAARIGGTPEALGELQLAQDTFNGAHAAVADALNNFGTQVCGGTLMRLYKDISRMQARKRFQDPPAVLKWLDYMQAELAAYGERMRSQVHAAIAPELFFALCKKLTAEGVQVQRSEVLKIAGQDSPLAWAFIGVKHA